MNGKVIIDTSVWVDFFRGLDAGLVEKVSVLLKTGRAAYTGIIALELLNGAKGLKDTEILHDAFDAMQCIKEKEKTFFDAGKMGYGLARKGFTAGTVDLLIAQTAIENNVAILTRDRHFEEIAVHIELKLMK